VGIKEMSGLGSSSGRDEVNGLLKLFDDVQKENLNIVLIATTNYPDSLDDALVRPGRFGRRIEVPYPTDEEIEKLVRYVEKTMKGKYGYKTATNRSD
jgi:SpoVK/Ycf46/Vps4 family AAA+-type ATPase